METLYEVRHVHVSIRRRMDEVYAFAARPENLPRWASGLGDAIRPSGDEWIADGPIGRVRVRVVPRNDFGVLDHDVVLETGVTAHNPIRVVANGEGCTVTFTLFRLPGVTAEKFAEDAEWVRKDLETLRRLVEGGAG